MSPSAVWAEREISGLLAFFINNKAEAGDNGNFKKTMFERAAASIAPLLAKGPAKSYRTCQNKWAAVCLFLLSGAKDVPYGLRNQGCLWVGVGCTTGATITPETASSWDAYVAKHPDAKPFHNHGWAHLSHVATLMPSPTTTTNVFHPTSTQSSQDISESDTETPDLNGNSQEVPDDEEDESQADSPNATPALPPTSRKRPACDPSTPAPKKRVCTTGATALQDMAASFAHFGDVMATALAPPSVSVAPTPRHCMDAIATARKTKLWLTCPQFVELINIFRQDASACDVYMCVFDDEDLRMEWVARLINLPTPIFAYF
ncbi:hypothetical protein DFP72DRAFT_862313 [Ephemerocybe angulata]|uniref:Myb/SANT-like domain-containing protein n=1 Tax=Ephemerocybe angulata TaxID=980116 RepID=A0A8H6LT91_9AGAR|nr:hypothetical protein DFP72DRAFT_862313 [Tulosesus angulatus]